MPEPMPSILARILARKQERLEEAQRRRPLDTLKSLAAERPATRDFAGIIDNSAGSSIGFTIIAEIKQRSPSRGLIRRDFDPLKIQQAYEQGGADAYSVLTEEDYFGGSLSHLSAVRKASGKPILRKDFMLHPYQLYEARVAGADAVLLIAAALEKGLLQELLGSARTLGLASLVEVHTPEELGLALDSGARIIGINNRNLHTFQVSLDTSIRLRKSIPPGYPVVSESGIHNPGDIRRLVAAGIRAFLIGEHFMRAADIAQAVRTLKTSLGEGV